MTLRVCIVCAGNICRSPIAEVVFRSKLAEADLDDVVTVESAGTGGWHAGEPADPRAVQALRTGGYDPGSHRARQFEPSWFGHFDLVLALDHANRTHLERIAPDDAARRKIRLLRSCQSRDEGEDGDLELEVPDPYYGGTSGFDHVLRLVEEAADGFIEAIGAQELQPPTG
jgi:protein-tyrosine phosphatase